MMCSTYQTTLASVSAFFIILSCLRDVESYRVSWNNLCDNHYRYFINTEQWSVLWAQNDRLRYSEFIYDAEIMNITVNNCPTDCFSVSLMERISEPTPVNISSTSSSVLATTQPSTRNHGDIIRECKINTSPYSIFPQCPDNITYVTSIDLYSSSQLIDKHRQKYPSTDLPDSFLDYSNTLTYPFLTNAASISCCPLKNVFLLIKHRFKEFFLYIIILTVVIISVIIISKDIFKYGFIIGPMRRRRHRLERKQYARYHAEYNSPIIRRPSCLNIPTLETIPEEEEIPF